MLTKLEKKMSRPDLLILFDIRHISDENALIFTKFSYLSIVRNNLIYELFAS